MLFGVAQLKGGVRAYRSTYLTGSRHAAAVWSSVWPTLPENSLLRELEAHDELLKSHGSTLRLITTVEDMDAEDGRTGVLPHSEGFHLPSVEPDMLESLWTEHSLRSLSLTWNNETDYGYSCYGDDAAPLKPEGKRLLRALEQSPLLLDLAHLNDAGFYEALDLYARLAARHALILPGDSGPSEGPDRRPAASTRRPRRTGRAGVLPGLPRRERIRRRGLAPH